MENFTNILKQFNVKQRIFVLIILLAFTSLISIVTTYFNSGYNSCNSIVKENRELLEDYIIISQLIREQQRQVAQTNSMVIRDTFIVNNSPVVTEVALAQNIMLDTIMAITQKHIK